MGKYVETRDNFLINKIAQEQAFQKLTNVKFERLCDIFDKIYLDYLGYRLEMLLSEAERESRCFEIRSNINKSKSGNLEVNLANKLFYSADRICELEDLIIRFCTFEMSEPRCIFITKEEIANVSVFVCDEDAILAIRGKEGDCVFLKLVDLYLISVVKEIATGKKYGLAIEYTWLDADNYREFDTKYNFDEVENKFFENRSKLILNVVFNDEVAEMLINE